MTPAQSLSSRWRETLATERNALREAYLVRPRPTWLLRKHARLIDAVLRDLWTHLELPRGATLVATGGYGRAELFPYSDVDVLILLAEDPDAGNRDGLERLVGQMWDVGLEIGHSVHTVTTCIEAARDDITVQTALLEARFLVGHRPRFQALMNGLRNDLDPRRFLEAKLLEQEQRHAKQHNAPYALEPHLKESPGGLRDLQIIQWVSRALRLGTRASDLERGGFTSHEESLLINKSQRTLDDFRIRLHYLAGRREDRLLFDYQTALAAQLEFSETPHRRAGEQVMQRYYRTAKSVVQVNTILLQSFAERVTPARSGESSLLNERFATRGDLLEAVADDLFERTPSAILESFLLLQQHQVLRGMTARTLRSLWHARDRVDATLRRDPHARTLFALILQQPRGIVHEFRRMNVYGVLGRYLPEFGRIVGQMQHDLFHVYTVDQHILMVMRNLRRFTMTEFAHEFPLCSELMSEFEGHWILYVAALYHDIAKGRGGDHSVLGMVDARRFCARHEMSSEDTALVVFLVEHHLSMSSVAQKQDVHDPQVLDAFAETVSTERRLIALYLLTVADIRGTSPKVWNGWKAKLLEDLFRGTRNVLAAGAVPLETAIADKRAEAIRLLRLYALPDAAKDSFWAQLDTSYFLRHDAQEIAWHSRNLYSRFDAEDAVVKVRLAPFGEGLQIFVYCKDRAGLFAGICGYLERANFSIVEAKIHTTRHAYALDTFLVLGEGDGTHYRDLIAMIEKDLGDALQGNSDWAPTARGRLARRARHYPVSPIVDIRADEQGRYQVLSVIANDRPGLLHALASTLSANAIRLHTAKINTLGERAEDVFLISGKALDSGKFVLKLEQELLRTVQAN